MLATMTSGGPAPPPQARAGPRARLAVGPSGPQHPLSCGPKCPLSTACPCSPAAQPRLKGPRVQLGLLIRRHKRDALVAPVCCQFCICRVQEQRGCGSPTLGFKGCHGQPGTQSAAGGAHQGRASSSWLGSEVPQTSCSCRNVQRWGDGTVGAVSYQSILRVDGLGGSCRPVGVAGGGATEGCPGRRLFPAAPSPSPAA